MSWPHVRALFPRRVSILTGVGFMFVATPAYADVELAPIVVIDFSSFNGTGFRPDPAQGQLDSDDWSIVLGPDGYEVPFGGIGEGGANGFAQGVSQGSTDDTGVFAFDVDGNGLIAFGVQPGGQTFTPGQIKLRLVNNTGAAITSLQVEYNLWVNNDVDHSSTFDLQRSANNVTYTPVGVGFTTTAVPDANGFTPNDFVEVVTPTVPIANGSQYYIAWASDDGEVEGSARDELGLEGITIRVLDVCGNGLTENAEECDDANATDGDGCAADCTLEEESTSSGGTDGETGTGTDTTAGESDTVADTSGGSVTDITATGASMSATGSVTDASATSATGGGTETEDGESEGGTGEDDDTSGCSCTTNARGDLGWGLLGLLVVARRRR